MANTDRLSFCLLLLFLLLFWLVAFFLFCFVFILFCFVFAGYEVGGGGGGGGGGGVTYVLRWFFLVVEKFDGQIMCHVYLTGKSYYDTITHQ